MGTIARREPTLAELLADPMMATVMRHSKTTADSLRSLMSEARERLEKARAAETSEPQPDS
jgi:hypothetical protein